MVSMSEDTRKALRYALPVIGAVVPITMMIRRARGCCAARTKEENLLRDTNVDLESALDTALKYVPGTPIEVELEEADGIPVWEVEIVPKKGGSTREVIIDAQTGDLLELKAETE